MSLKTSPKLLKALPKKDQETRHKIAIIKKLFRSVLILQKLKGLWGTTTALCQQIRQLRWNKQIVRKTQINKTKSRCNRKPEQTYKLQQK